MMLSLIPLDIINQPSNDLGCLNEECNDTGFPMKIVSTLVFHILRVHAKSVLIQQNTG